MRRENKGIAHTKRAHQKFRTRRALADQVEEIKYQGAEAIYHMLVDTYDRNYPAHDENFDHQEVSMDPRPAMDNEMVRDFFDFNTYEVQYSADFFPRQQPGPTFRLNPENPESDESD